MKRNTARAVGSRSSTVVQNAREGEMNFDQYHKMRTMWKKYAVLGLSFSVLPVLLDFFIKKTDPSFFFIGPVRVRIYYIGVAAALVMVVFSLKQLNRLRYSFYWEHLRSTAEPLNSAFGHPIYVPKYRAFVLRLPNLQAYKEAYVRKYGSIHLELIRKQREAKKSQKRETIKPLPLDPTMEASKKLEQRGRQIRELEKSFNDLSAQRICPEALQSFMAVNREATYRKQRALLVTAIKLQKEFNRKRTEDNSLEDEKPA